MPPAPHLPSPPAPSAPARGWARLLLLALGILAPVAGPAAVLHVRLDSPNPTPPYADWETAARVLQDAADAAQPGDTVRVTNGVYASGGRLAAGGLPARLSIPRGVMVESVSGPEFTVIQGAPGLFESNTIPRIGPNGLPVTNKYIGNGEGAVRCVVLARDAILAGFTLRDGHTRTRGPYETDQSGGGAWSDAGGQVVKSVLTGNTAHHLGGAAFGVELLHCRLEDNEARYGGAGAQSTFSECSLVGNRAERGGGAYFSQLVQCTIATNEAEIGAGAMGGVLTECTVTGNVAEKWGGGVSQGSVRKSRIEGNVAERGGGAFGATVFGSILSGNTAELGGGAAGGALRHCTVTANTAVSGGGAYLVEVENSLLHFNDALNGPNHEASTIRNSSTTPLPDTGSGNATEDPLLASATHLSTESTAAAPDVRPPELDTDLDGDPWQQPSSMGADQVLPGANVGPLRVALGLGAPRVAAGHPLPWRADIEGRTTASEWDFGDGTVVRNQAFPRHAWEQPGSYVVTLTAFNDEFPEGVRTSQTVEVLPQPVLLVAPSSLRPTPPFATWDTAATNIQDAIDAALVPGSLVLVTNGTYRHGGAPLPREVLTNRVLLHRPILVRSVQGPAATVIAGSGPLGESAVRGAWVGRGATLSGFTLTGGHTRTLGTRRPEQSGGGASGEAGGLITNCVLTANIASEFGAGAFHVALRTCVLSRNTSFDGGGGAYECLLEDSLLEANYATRSGGGASRSTLRRCQLIANTAPLGAGAYYGALEASTLERNVATDDGYGGGANGSTLVDCTLSANTAYVGGGAYAASLLRCRLDDNEARRDGGGATGCTLEDCLLAGNLAPHGGGASASLLTRCELTGNRASVAGGGADGGELEGCTLEGNVAYYGGASELATLRHCLVRGNAAVFGGASYRDLLVNCLLTHNTATNQGGGTFHSLVVHSTLTANTASAGGGGTYGGTNRNAIVFYNAAPQGPDTLDSALDHTCTSPTPNLPPGNTTHPPAFLHPESGNYRLRADSPAIDAGTNLLALAPDDFDGVPRPIDGNADDLAAPDLGAFEYDPETTDTNGDGVPDAWYLGYGLNPADPDVARENPDRDALTTYEEWIANTDPTDPASALTVTVSNLPPVTVTVPGTAGRLYTLLTRPLLGPDAALTESWTAVPGQSGLPGRDAPLALTDTNLLAAAYYRVEVRLADARVRPALATRLRAPRTVPAPAPGAASPALALVPAPDSDTIPLLAARSGGRPPAPSEDLASGSPLRPPPQPLDDSATGIQPDFTRRPALAALASRAALTALKPPPTGPYLVRIAADSDIPISPLLRGQEPFMLYAHSARIPTLEWARGASTRGVAGGTDAETYNWKDLTTHSRPHAWSYHADDPPAVTTLEWLLEARDYQAEPVFTINTRGTGRTVLDALGRRNWVIDPASNGPDFLARLAADWVRYANLIAPRYQLTEDQLLPPGLAASDPEADRILQELRSLGNGTNAWHYRLARASAPDIEVDPWIERPLLRTATNTLPTRKVTYWEIGNEVETPMNASDIQGTRGIDPAINLTPAQYVERYLLITDAMRRVDPDILVGPCPNNPWGPRAGVENQHLIQLLARPEAPVDLLYYHYYMIWYGNYFRPFDVNRNLRLLKNYGYLLHNQYLAQFARAGRTPVPAIISEWNPDYTIHPPLEGTMLSALATAESFMTMVELGAFAAHYWENPAGRASRFVFDRLPTHFGDRFLGSSFGPRTDDGTYAGPGAHPSFESQIRIYASRRTSDSKVFLWMLNLSDTVPFTVTWQHPRPVVEAQTHVLKDPARPTTFYTPHTQLAWISDPPRTEQPSSVLPPASLSILELTYAPAPPPSDPPEISDLLPTHGHAGSGLTLQGRGFSEIPSRNIVHVGLGRATVLAASPTSLQVVVPPTATYGPVTVTVLPDGRSAASRARFTLSTPADADVPGDPLTLVPMPGRLYPPEGAPMITAPAHLALADWRADGRLHLLGITSRSGSDLPHTIDLFPNTSLPGRPAFETPFCDPQTPRCSLPLNSSPAGLVCADFDGDGRLDLACADRHGWNVAAWRNAAPDPDRSFDLMGTFPTGQSPSAAAAQDIDGDGRPDLVVTHSAENALGVLRNLTPGPGTLIFATNAVFRASGPNPMTGAHTLATGDLTGDGRPDVVVASRTPAGLTLFENTSSPGKPRLTPLPDRLPDRLETLAVADLDGDGRLDLVGTGAWPDGGLVVWRNGEAGTFTRSAFPSTRDPRQLAFADIDGDGRVDAITVNNDTSSVSVFRNLGTPGTVAFAPRRDFVIPGLQPNDPVCLAAGDLDGDGRPEVAVGHYYSGIITLLKNQPQ